MSITEFSLGKKEYIPNPKTALLTNFLARPLMALAKPSKWDFEKGRVKFPVSVWANDQYGNCVIAARANHTLRMERVEYRRTVILSSEDVVTEYKAESLRQFGTAPQSPGDQYDQGLYMIEALKDWRTGDAWNVKPNKTAAPKRMGITAFGSIRSDDREGMRAAAYYLTGVQMGISLPVTAYRQMTEKKPWDIVAQETNESQPGSWGGHAVYSCHYDENGWYIWTWGFKQYATNAFIERYADEVWACAQDINSKSRFIDVEKFKQHLRDIGAKVIS